MAKKTPIIKETPGDDELEHEANKKRISAPKYKSERGPRDNRISVLVPKSLHEDLTLYTMATGTSVGEIVNGLLEDFVADEKRKAKIDALRALRSSE